MQWGPAFVRLNNTKATLADDIERMHAKGKNFALCLFPRIGTKGFDAALERYIGR